MYYVIRKNYQFIVVEAVKPPIKYVEEFDNEDEAQDCANESFDQYQEQLMYQSNQDDPDPYATRQSEMIEAYRNEY